MRKELTALGATLLFLLATPARAAGPVTLQAGGGVSLPTAPESFSDFWDMGFNLHGSLGLNIAAITGFQVIGKVEYHSFPFDWEKAGEVYDFSPSGFDGGDLRALAFGVDARFTLIPAPSPIRPYLFAGPGYANLTTSDLTFPPDPPPNTQVPDELDESEFYLNGGVGVVVRAGPTIGIFIEARYVNIFTDGDDIGFVPLTAGISF